MKLFDLMHFSGIAAFPTSSSSLLSVSVSASSFRFSCSGDELGPPSLALVSVLDERTKSAIST